MLYELGPMKTATEQNIKKLKKKLVTLYEDNVVN
jgi:hypothetical protein